MYVWRAGSRQEIGAFSSTTMVVTTIIQHPRLHAPAWVTPWLNRKVNRRRTIWPPFCLQILDALFPLANTTIGLELSTLTGAASKFDCPNTVHISVHVLSSYVKTTDGQAPAHTNWRPGEPTNNYGCIHVIDEPPDLTRGWNDRPCTGYPDGLAICQEWVWLWL